MQKRTGSSWLATWMLASGLTIGIVGNACAAGRDLAVLVVGKASEADLAAREKAVIEQLTRARSQRHLSHKILPIYSYHFDKSVERTYCEERLKIKASELLVVGLVELESGVPVRFVLRENAVKAPAAVATDIVERAQHDLAERGVVPASAQKPSTPVAVAVDPRAVIKVPELHGAPGKSGETKPTPSKSPEAHPVSSKPAETKPTPSKSPEAHPVSSKPAETKPSPSKSPEAHPVSSKPAETKPSPSKSPESSNAGNRSGETRTVPASGLALSTPAANSEHWTVQLGVYSDLTKAQTFVKLLKGALPHVEIRKGMRDNVQVYRVLTGTFSNQLQAYGRVKELKEDGINGFSVRVEPSLGTVVR